MKNLLLPLMLLSALTLSSSCSFFKEKVVPQAKEAAAKNITKAIVDVGECQAVEAVRADVNKLLKLESDEGMVVQALGQEAPAGSQQQGVVSEICKAAAELALPALLSKAVPEKWDCQLTDLTGQLGLLAEKACGKIDS